MRTFNLESGYESHRIRSRRFLAALTLVLAGPAAAGDALGQEPFDQDDAWEDTSWPADLPAGAPGWVDAFTAPDEGLSPAILNRLRAARDVELIVEYEPPNLSADAEADAERVRQGRRRVKQAVLDELRGLDIEERQDYRQLPMNVVRVRSLQAVEALRRHAGVKAVHEIGVKYHQLTESLPLIEQPEAQTLGATGEGTTVAVLDTGVDYTKPAFGSCAAPGAACSVVYAQDFGRDDGRPDDSGHGTNVAGIVLGAAPQAGIAALDVFRGSMAYDSDIIAAIDWSIANRDAYGIVAVNLSLGDGRKYTSPCRRSSYRAAFAGLYSAGILNAVASGNEGYSNGISSPACVPGAVSVGAVYDANVGSIRWSNCSDTVTSADRITCFSNSAGFLGLLAPGALIDAAGLRMGGTSQAAPHVAGAAAALKSVCAPATLNDLFAALQSGGTPITDARNGVTKPRLDVAAATRQLTGALACK